MRKITKEEYDKYNKQLIIVDDGSFSITKFTVNGNTEYWYVEKEYGRTVGLMNGSQLFHSIIEEMLLSKLKV